MTTRFWIGVASREHVHLGIAGGFSQLCHGKAHPLKRMTVNDWLIYYSPKERLGENTPCQKFTAIGKVIGEDIYPYEMFPGFIPGAILISSKRLTRLYALCSTTFLSSRTKDGGAMLSGSGTWKSREQISR